MGRVESTHPEREGLAAPPELRVEVHADGAALGRLERDWRGLEQRDSRCQLFQSWLWLAHLWRLDRAAGAEPRIVTVRDERGRLVALAPFVREARRPLGARVLRFMGQGPSDGNDCLVADEVDAREVAAAVRPWFARAIDELDVIDLDELPAEARVFDWIRGAPGSRAGWTVQRIAASVVQQVPLRGSFDSYSRSLPRAFRKQLERARRAVAASPDLRLVVDRGGVDPRGLLEMFIELHQARQHEKGERGLFRNAARCEVFGDLLRQMFVEGRAWILRLERGAATWAADLLLDHHGTLHAFSSGLRLDAEIARLGPGNLITAAGIELAFERGYRVYDLGRGEESYKRRFLPQSWCNARLLHHRLNGRGLSYRARDVVLERAYRSPWLRRLYAVARRSGARRADA